jgi:4-hydroxy-tetrahydrodipicolinate synthase
VKTLGRLITAMVTPFDDKLAVDYKQAQKLALALIKSGSDGVLVTGTTGESPSLTHEEEFRLWRDVKAAVGNKGTVFAGSGSNSTEEAVESSKEAEKIGVDACLLVVPYYNKPSQDGLYEHFKAIAKATKLPCILYNVPSRTVTNMTAETVIKLSQIENIVGIKEASGQMEQIGFILRDARKGFIVWSGNDQDTLPMMAMGGYGIISVASHLVGKQIKKMIEAFVSGETNAAMKIHLHLLPLFNKMFIVSNPCPVKYALNQIGFRVGKPRLPLVEPDAKSAQIIKDILKNYKIDLPV